jgi:hypothetical protein
LLLEPIILVRQNEKKPLARQSGKKPLRTDLSYAIHKSDTLRIIEPKVPCKPNSLPLTLKRRVKVHGRVCEGEDVAKKDEVGECGLCGRSKRKK